MSRIMFLAVAGELDELDDPDEQPASDKANWTITTIAIADFTLLIQLSIRDASLKLVWH
jgi:hypothetical protein